MNSFIRFCIVGTAGFCIDGGLLQAGIHFLGLGVLAARIPSFSAAVLSTWYMNRAFTFRARHKSFRESFPAYLMANGAGLGVNFGVYGLAVLLSPALASLPLIPLALGSVAGLALNYAASRYWVFRA
jgi:putative flippase GtrA